MSCSEKSQLMKRRILLCSSELGFRLPHYHLDICKAFSEVGSRDGAGLPSPSHLIPSKALEAIYDQLSLKHEAKL